MTGGLDKITADAEVIDSRDVIDRIEYLSSYGEELDQEGREELTALQSFAGELADYLPDWTYGETLIRDDYFATYAQELADDLGTVPGDATAWPLYCIDWERAARDLRMDYTSGELDGVTYWGRS